MLNFMVVGQDTIIMHAIDFLNDLDKKLNMYVLKVQEWYGWHFMEVTKIIQDNAKVMKFMGATIHYCNKYPT